MIESKQTWDGTIEGSDSAGVRFRHRTVRE